MSGKLWHGVSIEIETDNAAFADDERAEAARIIREAADFIENGGDARNLRDINGNTVGRVLFADMVTPQRYPPPDEYPTTTGRNPAMRGSGKSQDGA